MALLERAVEPDDSIEATSGEHLRRLLFGGRLNKEESLVHLNVTLDSLLFLCWLVTAQGLFEELGLSVAGGEIDQDPTEWVSPHKLLKLIIQSLRL